MPSSRGRSATFGRWRTRWCSRSVCAFREACESTAPSSTPIAIAMHGRPNACSGFSANAAGSSGLQEFVQMLARAAAHDSRWGTQVEIGKNLEYVSEAELERVSKKCAEVGRLLNGLIRAIRHSLRAKS